VEGFVIAPVFVVVADLAECVVLVLVAVGVVALVVVWFDVVVAWSGAAEIVVVCFGVVVLLLGLLRLFEFVGVVLLCFPLFETPLWSCLFLLVLWLDGPFCSSYSCYVIFY